jgi:hypothetical protein
MAHRALRDAQFFGGPGEADVPGSSLERLERIELWEASWHQSKSMRKTQGGG